MKLVLKTMMFYTIIAMLLTTTTTAQDTVLCSEYFNIHEMLTTPVDPVTTGTVEILVYLVAFNHTDVEERYRVKYPTEEDIDDYHQNLFPEDILGGYGPELPNGIHDPIKQLVDGYFNIMSKGQLRYSATYMQVLHEDAELECLEAQFCLFATDILDMELANHDDYGAIMIVLPDVNCGNAEDYIILTNKVMILNGYHLLREASRQADLPGIHAAFGGLLGFPESDFVEDETNNQVDDRIDLMGVGELYKSFTSPINHLRAGWINDDDVKRVRRSGIYRIWPLYLDVYDKGWSFDSYQYSSYDATENREPYQKLVGITFDTPDGEDQIMAWLRNDLTYKYDSVNEHTVVYDYSTQLLLYRFSDTDFDLESSETTWLYPGSSGGESLSDTYLIEAAMRVSDVFKAENMACSVEVDCVDPLTTPISILARVECPETSSNAVYDAFWVSGGNPDTSLNDQVVTYYFYFNTTEVSNYDSDNDISGYISFAIRDTECNGAHEHAIPLTYADDDAWSAEFGPVLYESMPDWVDLVVCFAELATNNISDEFFVQQEQTPYFIKEYTELPVRDGCLFGCAFGEGCGNCSDTFYCGDDECSCGETTNYDVAHDTCCSGRGIATCYDRPQILGTIECTCVCQDKFYGDHCEQINGSYIEVAAYFPLHKYEEDDFTLHIELLTSPTGDNVEVVCTVETEDGSQHNLESLIFAIGASGSQLADNINIDIPTGWSPGIEITCVPSTSATGNYFATLSNSVYVEINAFRDVTYPDNIVVKEYGDLTATIAWDASFQSDEFTDLTYFVLYKEGVEADNSTEYDYDTNPLGYNISNGQTSRNFTFSDLIEGSLYTVRISAQSVEHSAKSLSPPMFFFAMHYSDSCSHNNYTEAADDACGDCGNGTCRDGNCWCTGFYHGDNCELSGCYETSSSLSCSGRGVCTGESYFATCDCNQEAYGHYCEKFSWSNLSISFSDPVSDGAERYLPGRSFIFRWSNLDEQSRSESVELYYKYGAGTYEEVAALDWIYYDTVYYEENGMGRYALDVLPQVDLSVRDPDNAGYYFIRVVDNYYYALYGETSIILYNEAEIEIGTGDSGDVDDIDSEDENSGSIFDTLLSDEYRAYTIAGIVATATLSVGTCFFCVMKRKNDGYYSGGGTDDMAEEYEDNLEMQHRS